MDILTIAVIGTLNVACFFVGAKVGNMVVKGKEVKLPTINPMEAYKHKQEKKMTKSERERIDVILRNIERYDGSPFGQEEVPRG